MECTVQVMMENLARALDIVPVIAKVTREGHRIGNRLPRDVLTGRTQAPTIANEHSGEIECEEFLDGLLKAYAGKCA